MTFLSQHGLSRRVALACALALAAPCLMPAGHARAAEMSTLDRLVAKDEINYMVSTNFDELKPTTAKTRTSALYAQITKNLPGNAAGAKASADACGGRISHSAIYVYHIDWTKNADGWRMSHIALRRKS